MADKTDGEIVTKLAEDIAIIGTCATAAIVTTKLPRWLALIVGAGYAYGVWRYGNEMYRRDTAYRVKRSLYGTWVDEIR